MKAYSSFVLMYECLVTHAKKDFNLIFKKQLFEYQVICTYNLANGWTRIMMNLLQVELQK